MKLLRPGVVPYGQALAWQYSLRQRLQEGTAHDPVGYLLCLEHPPVVTLGKRGRLEAIFGLPALREQGTQFFKIDRGGQATYHGPGQLVIYPIVDLSALDMGVVDVIRGLAGALADTLGDYGVDAAYDTDHPGLWTAEKPRAHKIASVGMRVSGGVTIHGAAINLVNDLTPFSLFVPCGMPESPMTRLLDRTDQPAETCGVDAFLERFLPRFSTVLDQDFEALELPRPARQDWVAPMAL